LEAVSQLGVNYISDGVRDVMHTPPEV